MQATAYNGARTVSAFLVTYARTSIKKSVTYVTIVSMFNLGFVTGHSFSEAIILNDLNNILSQFFTSSKKL